MAIEACEIEIGGCASNYGGGASVRIVVISGHNRIVALTHFTNASQVIARIEVSLIAAVITLLIDIERHVIVGVSKLTLLHPAPDKLACGRRSFTSPLHDLREAAQAIVTELTPIIGSGVIDRDQPVGPVPFERAGRAVVNQAPVGIIGQRSIDSTTLACNFV